MSLYVPLEKTSQLPKRYVLSRGYYVGHEALDMVGVTGQAVIAAQSGRVFASSWEGNPPGPSGPWAFGGGWTVILDHYGLGNRRSKSVYAHLSKLLVPAGKWVLRGQKIGLAGSTGNSTGNHLHWSVAEAHGNPLLYASYRWVDPRLYMKAHAYMNGSQGHGSRINSPFFNNTFTINAGVNIRERPTTGSKVLYTTRSKHNTCFIDDVLGSTYAGVKVWYRLWHSTLGECYVHSKLGVLS